MSIEDDIAFLERVPTLRLLGRTALRILAIGAESRYVHGGEALFHAGDPADGGYVIQEGSFELRPTAQLAAPRKASGAIGSANEALRVPSASCAMPMRASRQAK